MAQETDLRSHLLLSIQRALLGAVSPALRGVTCGTDGQQVKLRFVFDGVISPADLEEAQVAASEVIADFPAPWTLNDEYVRLDAPAPLKAQALARWAYMRAEGQTLTL